MRNSTTGPIAIVGAACRYPGADDPEQLWWNVLARRSAFRDIPAERLNLLDYRGAGADTVSVRRAGLLEGFAFDRHRFHVGGRAYNAADLSHWLALDVADRALVEAGFEAGRGLPLDQTGVVIGNTLTGEISRAALMRHRWPYVRRQVAEALAGEAWDEPRADAFLERLEASFKAPFAEPDEESLAGGLANTIAGRIANHFDLHGGGFTVDGACASSLLAVEQGCLALQTGDLRVVLVGGVDVSLDPFELVGFSRTGALAEDEMRVFDRRPTGFLPGEGCGFLVLMSCDDAVAQGRPIQGVIRGWGRSSDGAGGLTRPTVRGQSLALRRAYERAGFGPDSIAFFEAHGTGTAVGDTIEAATLNGVLRKAGSAERHAVGSVKALIGHTKAAAGMAGVLKALGALRHQVLPPTAGCVEPHGELTDPDGFLRVLDEPELYAGAGPMRVGVSSMGFGGINTHVVLEGSTHLRRRSWTAVERRCATPPQGLELLLLRATSLAGLVERIELLASRVKVLSAAELVDLAADLAQQCRVGAGDLRAAILAPDARTAAERLSSLLRTLSSADGDLPFGVTLDGVFMDGVYLAHCSEVPRLGFLFPGQGSPSRLDGGAWRRRFPQVAELYERLGAVQGGADARPEPATETSIAQPALVTASQAGLAVAAALGLRAAAALGHSLGELGALAWAGVWDNDTWLEIARSRGRAMSEAGQRNGAMAYVQAGESELAAWPSAGPAGSVVIAAHNGPRSLVIAGTEDAVERLVEIAASHGRRAARLAVSHAFHSPLMAEVEKVWSPVLQRLLQEAPSTSVDLSRVISTVTGDELAPGQDLSELLSRQLTEPVLFHSALKTLARRVDLLLEIGTGRVLGDLARRATSLPCVSLDVGAGDLRGLLHSVATLFVHGAELDPRALFRDRFVRPFEDRERRFISNPCETAPAREFQPPHSRADNTPSVAGSSTPPTDPDPTQSTIREPGRNPSTIEALEVVMSQVAARLDLPVTSLKGDGRLLSDYHLSSISVGEIVTRAARDLGLEPPAAPTEYADASLDEVAAALTGLRAFDQVEVEPVPDGVEAWVRTFEVRWQEETRPHVLEPPTGCFVYPGEDPLSRHLISIVGVVESDEAKSRLLVLDGTFCEPALERLLVACHDLLAEPSTAPPLCVVEIDGGGTRGLGSCGFAAFLRSLSLEAPSASIQIVQVPSEALHDPLGWGERIVGESIRAKAGFRQVRLTPQRRLVPIWHHAPLQLEATMHDLALPTAGDVVLITGGAKGIGAECALALGRRHECHMALVGRSDPSHDEELQRNLQRFERHGIRWSYHCADVTDSEAVATATRRIRTEHGPVRFLIHAAGRNEPCPVAGLDVRRIVDTLEPKVGGLQNLLDCLDSDELCRVVAFGSIIGRMGLQGEAHYAFANEALRRRLEDFGRRQPACHTLCLDWSVWEGVGMGARLADLEALSRRGVTALTVDDGVHVFLDTFLASAPPSLIVTGRFGNPPTARLEPVELPLRRFLESPRLFVPGVELVVDAELSHVQDPYLAEHSLDGEPLFPTVMALEAAAQVARALVDDGRVDGAVGFEALDILRPLVVPADESITLRTAAVARPDGTVSAALRSSRTHFAVDHFRLTVRFDITPPLALRPMNASAAATVPQEDEIPPPTCQDIDVIYDHLLFQRGRFRCLKGYRSLRARSCIAELEPGDGSWFGALLPQELTLGHAGRRDAVLHAVQACIPHQTVLPVATASWWTRSCVADARAWRAHAVEKGTVDGDLIYDIDVWTVDDELVETWRGLVLRPAGRPRSPQDLPAALLGPYLERRLEDLLPGAGLQVAVLSSDDARSSRGPNAVAQCLSLSSGRRPELLHRADGKPELADTASTVSLSHLGDITLAVVGRGALGCDVEAVQARSADTWQGLLGERRQLLEALSFKHDGIPEITEPTDQLATRLWTLIEGLEKAGRPPQVPVTFERATDDGWLIFRCGRHTAATVLWTPPTRETPIAIAVVAESALIH